jgi:triple functional domain protein
VDQLTKYLNVSELTKDFGGSLHYIHEEWVELRRIVQDFVGHAADMLDRIDQCKKALLNAELANDLTSTDALLIEHHTLKKKLNKYPVELLEEEGYKILSRLDPKFDPYDPRHSSLTNGSSRNCISQNPDFQAALSRVRLQLDRLHNVRGQLLQAWQNRLEKLEQCRQLRAFEQQAEQVGSFDFMEKKFFLVHSISFFKKKKNSNFLHFFRFGNFSVFLD